MKKIFFILLILSSFIYAKSIDLDLSKIQNYQVLKNYYVKDSDKFLFIRSYSLNNNNYILAINLNSLKISILNQKEVFKFKKTNNNILENTNYKTLLEKSSLNSNALVNSGINMNFSKNPETIFLTIDMCPSSKKGFEKEFFENLKKQYKNNIPVSIAITYKWVKSHQKEFLWLLKNKTIFNITWINHSKTHYYNCNEKDHSKNFMLHNIKEFEDEILDVEKMLILNNEIPSILFRFPGLVSNKYLVDSLVNKYSLIPIGTNNWLANNKKPIEKGDIILLHGNLNEHKGIDMINHSINSFELGSIIEALKEK